MLFFSAKMSFLGLPTRALLKTVAAWWTAAFSLLIPRCLQNGLLFRSTLRWYVRTSLSYTSIPSVAFRGKPRAHGICVLSI